MGTMSELDAAVRDLKAAGAALTAAAESLTALFSAKHGQSAVEQTAVSGLTEPEAVPETAASEPEPAQDETVITLEDVRGELAGICAKGYGPQVKKLIEKHGGRTLTDVPQDQYVDLILAARALCGEG